MRQRTRIAFQHSRDRRERRRRGERMHAADVFVEHRAEREDVGARVGRPPFSCSGAMYAGVPISMPGSVTTAGGCGMPLLDACETEVQDLQPPVARPHDVFRLEVAMNDAPRVRRGQRRGDLPRGAHDLGRRRTLAPGDFFAKGLAIDELGGDEQLAVEFFERVDGADSRMGQSGRGPRFSPQALSVLRVARQVRRERFERDLSSQPRVGRQVHPSHPAAAQLLDDRVGPDRSAAAGPFRRPGDPAPARRQVRSGRCRRARGARAAKALRRARPDRRRPAARPTIGARLRRARAAASKMSADAVMLFGCHVAGR